MDLEEAVRRFEAVHLHRNHDEELARFQNENYHLKLALNEKDQELRKLLHRGIYPESQLDSSMYMDSNKSEADLDVVTHFSGSPYKGKRTDSKATESSLATTTMSTVKAEQQAFKKSVIPFLERMVGALQMNSILKKETDELAANFEKFKELPQDADLLTTVLDDVLYYTRQTSAILNRELKFKQLSQRLEYLFSIFLDPTEYDMNPQEHIEYLREEITDTLLKIFHHKTLPPNCIPRGKPSLLDFEDNYELDKCAKNGDTPFPRGEEYKIKNIEEGFDICANAMNQAFGDKKELRQHDSTMLSPRGRFMVKRTNTHKEKRRLRENKECLEFMPIGYDDNVLNAKTPQRQTQKSAPNDYEFTPKANDENDSLQMFFQEQANYYDLTAGRSRK